ncbi:hypothetical protein [Geobacillus stearothermophilus]|uniref:Uncharacterized protein n=1 Tax=Geobacillus stearothermophilus TaxID=1422 RepID=A0A150MAC5_GEOSE|nr:hypothetical protein [Geobacillus stearothermophilus]KYD21494.1 hypothetical protein B4109_2441 [Geobacillus stearothermophilus]MED5042243.1 hypothetical protein [Geobacillus stearothermophilus]
MKRMPWKVMATSAAASLLLASGCSAVGEKENGRSAEAPRLHVPVADDHFDTAGNMFAYSEFELSGEPLAEGLGLDLDTLDARKPDEPTTRIPSTATCCCKCFATSMPCISMKKRARL